MNDDWDGDRAWAGRRVHPASQIWFSASTLRFAAELPLATLPAAALTSPFALPRASVVTLFERGRAFTQLQWTQDCFLIRPEDEESWKNGEEIPRVLSRAVSSSTYGSRFEFNNDTGRMHNPLRHKPHVWLFKADPRELVLVLNEGLRQEVVQTPFKLHRVRVWLEVTFRRKIKLLSVRFEANLLHLVDGDVDLARLAGADRPLHWRVSPTRQ